MITKKVVFKYNNDPLPNLLLHSQKNLVGALPEIYYGRGGFVELGNFDKHF